MTSDVQLHWTNKHLPLRAEGAALYRWVQPSDLEATAQPVLTPMLGGFPDAKDNLLAIGDGLDVIEVLDAQTSALRDGIRLVYIDPPFNTGKTFNQYGDNLATPMWLSMMADRLHALKPHLRPDGSVWVHLDDSQIHRARAVMDEVFGESAFVTTVVWQKKTTRDSRAAFSPNHDNILVYAPCGPKEWKISRNLLVKEASALRNRDNDPRGPWADAPFTAPGYRKAQQYEIVTPTGQVLRPPRGRSWYATEPTYLDLLADNRIWFPKGGSGSPRIKLFPHQLRGLVPFTVWGGADVATNDDAKRHLLDLFPDVSVFDTPKPEELLERIIHISTNTGDLVVDLFAGSGTTATAAHKMRRRWIAVERNSQTVLDFTYPRISAVVEGRDKGGITGQVAWEGGGQFKVLHVAPRFGKLTGHEAAKGIKERLKENGLVGEMNPILASA
ncbi:site-specific DNA-methyltransferase [Mycobacterium sp. E2989]|uniref:site-specific DNA-methyltransferase n=1 Tax=Mycobacterium sp. E2989 TaxID=1834140 RepID=UPI0009EF314F|nr:site-specific DNA-methyltransferase [Mycobacterium sp. E2989]